MKLEEAIEVLKINGYKHTDKREELLKILAKQNRYLSAKEILDEIQKQFPNLSFDTIYRNLYLFTDLDILEVTEIAGEKHFRFTCSSDTHHHHFICLDCGKSKQIDLCPVKEMADKLRDYEITGHKFEIYGRCPDCHEQSDALQ